MASGGVNHFHILPRKLACPLKINGWKMKCPFEMIPFLVDMLIFSGQISKLCNSYFIFDYINQPMVG